MPQSWVSADRQVFDGAGSITSLTLVSDGVGVADVTVKDGASPDGETLATLRALQNDTRHLPFAHPVEVFDGLYVDIGSNVEGVLVVWRRPL